MTNFRHSHANSVIIIYSHSNHRIRARHLSAFNFRLHLPTEMPEHTHNRQQPKFVYTLSTLITVSEYFLFFFIIYTLPYSTTKFCCVLLFALTTQHKQPQNKSPLQLTISPSLPSPAAPFNCPSTTKS